jgi:hypothetical protein
MNDENRLEGSLGAGCAWAPRSQAASGWPTSRVGARLARATSLLLIVLSLNAFAGNDDTFASLKVGNRTYQNVKVTTKGKNFIIISHSGGIASIKVSELPLEVLQKLGYVAPPKPRHHIKEGPMWAGVAIPKADVAIIKPLKAELSQVWDRISQAWDRTRLASKIQLLKDNRRAVIVAAAILLVAYAFYSYCCMLICQKTGNKPGPWVFVPLFQAFPMLRAASMSPWWFVALLIPGVNLLAYVVWSLKIVEARQKTVPLAILLIFPLTSWFAFLFLAFSDGPVPGEVEISVEIITPQSVLSA